MTSIDAPPHTCATSQYDSGLKGPHFLNIIILVLIVLSSSSSPFSTACRHRIRLKYAGPDGAQWRAMAVMPMDDRNSSGGGSSSLIENGEKETSLLQITKRPFYVP